MMNRSLGHIYFAGMLALSIILAGCGGKLPARVSGTVTLDGEPLPVGTVVFHPAGEGATAYGSIDKDGNYTVQSGADRGLVPGEYAVTVVATTGPPPDGKLLTPSRYGRPNKSGLRCTVQAGGNRFDISLQSE